MRTRVVISLALFCLTQMSWAMSKDGSIRSIALDDGLVYAVRVAVREGSTTIRFPGPIESWSAGRCAVEPYSASQVSAQQYQQLPVEAEFRLTYAPGRNYIVLRALTAEASDTLTVIYGGTPYVIRLAASYEPDYVVSFRPRNSIGRAKREVTPEVLLGLIDRAKAYTLLAQTYPHTTVGIMYDTPGRITQYKDFDVVIAEVWRFDEHDALVFDCIIRNHSAAPLCYKPQSLAVGLAGAIFPAAVADADGYVPANGESRIYLGFCGTPHGGRNNLSTKNDWSILVPRGRVVSQPKPKPGGGPEFRQPEYEEVELPR